MNGLDANILRILQLKGEKQMENLNGLSKWTSKEIQSLNVWVNQTFLTFKFYVDIECWE